MAQLRTGKLTRLPCAVLIALLLAMRLISPAGFMPAFDHGAVTIVICPDADPVAPAMAGHHHQGHSKKLHQPCPYAAGSALATFGGEFAALITFAVIGFALLIGRPFTFIERHRAYDRPPLRGPPLPVQV